MRFLKNSFHYVGKQILPTACIACRQIQADSICIKCLRSLYDDCLIHYECCYQCGIPLQSKDVLKGRCKCCLNTAPFFDQTICLDRYEGALKEALHELKYAKRIAYAHGLASAWNHALAPLLEDGDINYLFPVPLSPKNLLARGFNQSWELAKRLQCGRHIQKLPLALKRHHQADHQAGRSIQARQAAIRGMYYIDDKYLDCLANKTVVIFDDVMTSGATLNEIARILKMSGVSHVINWVLLRTTKLAR
jgi:ComF family protein